MEHELKVEHGAHATLIVDWSGGRVSFDPLDPPGEGPIVVTCPEHERLLGAQHSVESGGAPVVVSSPEILAWLAERGALDARQGPADVGALRLALEPYTPVPYVTLREGIRKTASALKAPAAALGRLRRRAELPGGAPQVVQVSFPGGRRLLHLGNSLHRWTPERWLSECSERFGGADVVIAGVDYDEVPHFMARLPRFKARQILLVHQTEGVRRALGMPVQALGPLATDFVRRGTRAAVLQSGERWVG